MDSAEFLDLLGNANRRRILQLLARKPCYVTEISEFLGVSPKAVIDHLRKLEDAGLVESRTDEKRRKYFSISRHIRLEVTVSPYEFGTKSAYPTNSRLDVTSCQWLSVEFDDDALPEEGTASEDADEPPVENPGEPDDPPAETSDSTEQSDSEATLVGAEDHVVTLVKQLREYQQLERELSLVQRWTQGRITEFRDRMTRTIDDGDPRLVSEILLQLAEDAMQVEDISRELEVPPHIVEDVLEGLAADGVVHRDGHSWKLDE
jgi:ArsR family transcriptional regulator